MDRKRKDKKKERRKERKKMKHSDNKLLMSSHQYTHMN